MNKTPLIIQLLGKSRAGKDWTAEQLKLYYESLNKSVDILSYAAPLKQITAKLFDISLDKLNDFKNRPNSVSIRVHDNSLPASVINLEKETNFRTILQRMGNEAIKPIFGKDVWAKLMQQSIKSSTADIIIIPDCRFHTELSLIGGITLRVINNSLSQHSNHASEIELAYTQTNYTLDNTDYTATPTIINKLAQRIYDEHS